jgi:hypothetical protein
MFARGFVRTATCLPLYIADEIIVAAHKGQTSLGDLSSVGLGVVNSYLFPPGRSWLRALKG